MTGIVRCSVSQLEISELEEQKRQAEQEVTQLQEALNKLQLQNGGRGGGWSSEQERKCDVHVRIYAVCV